MGSGSNDDDDRCKGRPLSPARLPWPTTVPQLQSMQNTGFQPNSKIAGEQGLTDRARAKRKQTRPSNSPSFPSSLGAGLASAPQASAVLCMWPRRSALPRSRVTTLPRYSMPRRDRHSSRWRLDHHPSHHSVSIVQHLVLNCHPDSRADDNIACRQRPSNTIYQTPCLAAAFNITGCCPTCIPQATQEFLRCLDRHVVRDARDVCLSR